MLARLAKIRAKGVMTAILTQNLATFTRYRTSGTEPMLQTKTGLTQNVGEPQGQIFLHGEQAGFVPTGQPLVILLHVRQAGHTRVFGAQGAAHGSLMTACGSSEQTGATRR